MNNNTWYFQQAANSLDLFMQAIDNMNDVDGEIEKLFSELISNTQYQTENTIKFLRFVENEIDHLENHRKIIVQEKRKLEDLLNKVKEFILKKIETMGDKPFESKIGKLKAQKNSVASVEIEFNTFDTHKFEAVHEETILQYNLQLFVKPVTFYKLDKVAIKKYIENGGKVDGCSLKIGKHLTGYKLKKLKESKENDDIFIE